MGARDRPDHAGVSKAASTTIARQLAFLKAYGMSGNVWAAGQAVDPPVPRSSVRGWREDPIFAQAYVDAKYDSDERIVDSVREWAEDGIPIELHHQGEPTNKSVKKRSERMMGDLLEVKA